ncbi:DUF3157 family protein [Shewanella eurypsychrophilus]|uniref:DUF3157 family protein n=1 Tax=Shewanella eurypsychrophilus TaxID=2593656 RepID=A0ABX6VBY5_9GAMM|nr:MULTISPECIES: DUF3157 family protein [Shewanella]QFU25016.1 DUF3157 family protein [Shewanella sp. YLB-09]QPG60192.1 DUF3157 family protein [Shewanella eurypsychrophilus]
MHKRLKFLSAFALLVIAVPSLAIAATETVASLTLENGAKVRLNDDFTWEYVILETVPVVNSETKSQTPLAIAAGTSASIEIAKAAPQATQATQAISQTMTATAMSQAELLKSTAKAGVKVSFAKAEWDDDGRLGLTFDLASTSSEHYVMIEMDVTLYDDTGKTLKTETLKVWKAIFRSADTYLRKGEQRQSRTFWIEGIDASQWSKQLLSLKIGEMNSRM